MTVITVPEKTGVTSRAARFIAVIGVLVNNTGSGKPKAMLNPEMQK